MRNQLFENALPMHVWTTPVVAASGELKNHHGITGNSIIVDGCPNGSASAQLFAS
jgi:hypothetical protein